MQLESSYETNKVTSTISYLYGIVTMTRIIGTFCLVHLELSLEEVKLSLPSSLTRRPWIKIQAHINQSLCNSVKEVLGIIVWLLKDRACLDGAGRKRARIALYRSKNNVY